MNIHTIITHIHPHLDEIVAIWLLLLFGELLFPGVKRAKIVYWDTGGLTPDGRSAEEWEAKGYLLIGIGKGRFDEHSSSQETTERQKDQCSATLVAKALGVDQEPALGLILKYTLNNDAKGSSNPFDVVDRIKLFYSQKPNNPELALNWVFDYMDAKFDEQKGFFNATKEQFERSAKVEKIIGPKEMELTLVSIESDNEQINKYARSDYGINADIVAVKRSTGNVQVFFNQKRGLKPYDLIKILRSEEQIASGNIFISDWSQLSTYGKAFDKDVWYFQENTQTIMNGSLTAKVPPTKLSFEKIIWAIKIGLNPEYFENDDCFSDICRGKECPFYKYGLSRCRNVRREKTMIDDKK